MKRIIYLACFNLLALCVISCDKDQITPIQTNESAGPDNQLSVSGCTNYSYQTKTGTEDLGTAGTEVMIVVFEPKVTPAQQLSILSQFSIFNAISSSMLNDSGDKLQFVELNANATCSSVEAMLTSLGANAKVKYAYPTFAQPLNSSFLWIGLDCEFMVNLTNANQFSQLKKLAKLTNTVVVGKLGSDTYILGTTKNSGDVLQMCTYFNQNSIVQSAEPNYIFQLAPLKYQKLSDLQQAEISTAN